jgi:hypothetical protein
MRLAGRVGCAERWLVAASRRVLPPHARSDIRDQGQAEHPELRQALGLLATDRRAGAARVA